jgi:hypothetical protein
LFSGLPSADVGLILSTLNESLPTIKIFQRNHDCASIARCVDGFGHGGFNLLFCACLSMGSPFHTSFFHLTPSQDGEEWL